MKKLSFLLLSFCLSLNLSARENPFELTNAFEEEMGRIIELNESSLPHEVIQEEQYINEIQEKIEEKTTKKEEVQEKPKEIVYTKEEVDKLIQTTKTQAQQQAKMLIKKEIQKAKVLEPEQIVYVKPRADIINEEFLTKEILPFVKIEFNDDKLMIDSKYSISKKFNLDKENKIVIDYKADENFFTKRENLQSKSFKKITVGNHQKENYFRVVLELNTNTSNFDVSYKDNLITIFRNN